MIAQSFPLSTSVPVPSSHWDGDNAVDLFTDCGTPWLAVFDGVSSPADYNLGGHTIMLTASDGTQAYYAHGLPERVSGQVHAGDVIGYVSDSGNAQGTGCHLHFAVGTINSNGGGSINPADWLAGSNSGGGDPSLIPAVAGSIGIIALLVLLFVVTQ